MRLSFSFALALFLFVPSIAQAASGKAVISPTEEGSSVAGTVTLSDGAAGLHVRVSVQNTSPGKHGLHFHDFGECGDTGKKAGSHFNPDAVEHGLVTRDGLLRAHAGDLGNIDVAADGTGILEATIPGLCLAGCKYSVGGRSVILHAKEDDFGQPVGNAGDRIGCGPILLAAE